jgi:hypothetical protein
MPARPIKAGHSSGETCARNSYYVNLELFEAFQPLAIQALKPAGPCGHPAPRRPGVRPPSLPRIDSLQPLSARTSLFHPLSYPGFGWVSGRFAGAVFGRFCARVRERVFGHHFRWSSAPLGSVFAQIACFFSAKFSPARVLLLRLDADGTGGRRVVLADQTMRENQRAHPASVPYRTGLSTRIIGLGRGPALHFFEPLAGNGGRAILRGRRRSGKSRAEGRGTRALSWYAPRAGHHGSSPTLGKPGRVREGFAL